MPQDRTDEKVVILRRAERDSGPWCVLGICGRRDAGAHIRRYAERLGDIRFTQLSSVTAEYMLLPFTPKHVTIARGRVNATGG